MKVFPFFILPLFLLSCSEEIKPKELRVQKYPVEPCEVVSWFSLPVITHGYNGKKHENVTVETYIKNSRFDSIIKTYNIENNGKMYDEIRLEKSFNLPEEINSSVDLKILFEDSPIFYITETKTGWIKRVVGDNSWYDCAIQNCRVNGEITGGNILLKNPKFHYPK